MNLSSLPICLYISRKSPLTLVSLEQALVYVATRWRAGRKIGEDKFKTIMRKAEYKPVGGKRKTDWRICDIDRAWEQLGLLQGNRIVVGRK